MKLLRSLRLIINYKTFIVTFLSLFSTVVCEYYGIAANFPLTIVGVAIVFPIVFSINSAYTRRENTLAHLGDFKNHLTAIYHASRDWITPADADFQQRTKNLLMETYNQLQELFTSEDDEAIQHHEKEMAKRLSRLSEFVQQFRKYGLHSTEMSRLSQYVARLGGAVENMKVVLKYRTPITLRAYSKISIYSFPISYGPFFVYTAQEYTHGLTYFMPVLFSFILVSLDNIQNHLENPFDQIGEDDIRFGASHFEGMLT